MTLQKVGGASQPAATSADPTGEEGWIRGPMGEVPKWGHSLTSIVGPCLAALCLLTTAAVILDYVNVHVTPFWWQRLAVIKVQPEQGFAFTSPPADPRWSSVESQSFARVLEDGRSLGPGDALHTDIRMKGQGRYSFWRNTLYFSSSDNSDPRTNGRNYQAEGPTAIPDPLLGPAYLAAALAWVLTLSLRSSRRFVFLLFRSLVTRLIQTGSLILRSSATWTSKSAASPWLSPAILFAILAVAIQRSLPDLRVPEVGGNALEVLYPMLARNIGTAAREGHTVSVVVIALMLFPAYRRTGLAGGVSSLVLTVLLFLSPLLALWSTGYTDGFIIGGLLPWSDARGYYWDANRLLEGSGFSSFSSRRPMFPGLLATILGLTQRDLQLTLLVMTIVAAISSFMLARELSKSHGAACGVMVLIILFLFAREFIGKTTTENLGISLGAVSLAVLWRGVRLARQPVIWLGMLLTCLALNARAGAFLVLPALIIWGTWRFRGGKLLSLRFLVGGTASVLAGFMLNLLLLNAVSTGDGQVFSNYSYTLYGLAVGGKGWGQVLLDHPELSAIREPGLSREIYRLAFDTIRSDPSGLPTGILKAWGDFFNPTAWGVFSFVYVWDLSHEAIAARLALYALSAVGLFWLVVRRQEPTNSMMLAASAGIVISVPLVPPIDSDQMRAYAATVPIVAVLAATGLHTILTRGQASAANLTSDFSRTSWLPAAFGIGLALLSLFGPVVIRSTSQRTAPGPLACQPGEDALTVRLAPRSSFQVVPDSSVPGLFPPQIRLSEFRENARRSVSALYPGLSEQLGSIGPNERVMLSLNLRDSFSGSVSDYGQDVWLVVDAGKTAAERGTVDVCGTLVQDERLRDYRLYHASSVQAVQRP